MRLLLLGATGLVGSHVMDLAVEDERIDEVIAPVRRPLAQRFGLTAPRVDFDRLPEDSPWWQADAAICALGTTMKKAGSRDAFQRVDHGYPLEAARLAHRHGVRTFVLNSAMGADPDSRFFYNRVKGALERDLQAVGFESLTLVRPGLIGGEREEFRLGEHTATLLLGALGPVLPRRWRINPAERIAGLMIEAAVAGRAGVHVVESGDI